MKKWNSYKNHISQQTYDSIIIGSGIGGLCTAATIEYAGGKCIGFGETFQDWRLDPYL